MTTLTLDQLRADLGRINAHRLATTNVIAVQHTAGENVFVEVDTSTADADLADAKDSEARLEAELKEAETERDRLDDENQKLVAMHEEFADKESGITPAAYRAQAEACVQSRDNYQRAMNEARAECDALRKRKGVTCQLFKHEREVLALLSNMARGSAEFTEIKTRATELLKALHTP